jgi:hypothetical protein
MRGQRIDPGVCDALMQMLPIAEARLRFALFRQAYRAFGWSLRAIPADPIPPITSWAEFGPRFEAYRLAMMDLHASAITYTDVLRRHYRIRAAVDANTVRAARSTPAQLGPVGVSARNSPLALMLSSARSARPSKDEAALTAVSTAKSRAPPIFDVYANQTTRLAGFTCEVAGGCA